MTTSTHARRFTKGKKSRKTHKQGHPWGLNRNGRRNHQLAVERADRREARLKERIANAKRAKKLDLSPGRMVQAEKGLRRAQVRAQHVAAIMRGEDPKVRVMK